MIAVLLHHTLGGDVPSRAEGSKREYLNIVKKIKVSSRAVVFLCSDR